MFELDLSLISNPSDPLFPIRLFWFLFTNGGAILLIPLFLWLVYRVYMNIIWSRFFNKMEFVLLAIDIPPSIKPSIRSVEHVFTHFYGMYRTPSLIDLYIDGYLSPRLSLELVYIGGEVRYIVRCMKPFRDLVEAAFYAQYPDAEITEVEDYAKEATMTFPSNEYDLWGSDIVYIKPEEIPIRTYEDFEDRIEGLYADPLRSLLETLATLSPFEQVWIQILLVPVDLGAWSKRSQEFAKKLAGIAAKQKRSVISDVFGWFGSQIEGFINYVAGWEGNGGATESKSPEVYSLMMHLTPREKDLIEAVQKKSERVSYCTKIRYIYVGKKEYFNKGRGVSAIFGYFNQFNGLNGLKPQAETKTQVAYFLRKRRTEWRKNKLLKYYKKRDVLTITGMGQMMDVAELASLYHFPNTEEDVVPSAVRRSSGGKGEAPPGVPYEGMENEFADDDHPKKPSQPSGPPENLPFIE